MFFVCRAGALDIVNCVLCSRGPGAAGFPILSFSACVDFGGFAFGFQRAVQDASMRLRQSHERTRQHATGFPMFPFRKVLLWAAEQTTDTQRHVAEEAACQLLQRFSGRPPHIAGTLRMAQTDRGEASSGRHLQTSNPATLGKPGGPGEQ